MKPKRLSKQSDLRLRILLASVLVAFAVLSRLVPHPANFAPIAAVAIFGGSILPRKWALLLPLSAMILSDLVIGMHSLVLLTWGSFAIIALGSNLLLKKLKASHITIASVSASVFFYLVSNFGVWAEGQLYPRNLSGLISCYYNALPFFQNTLAGDLVYSAILFGAYAFAYKLATHQKQLPSHA